MIEVALDRAGAVGGSTRCLPRRSRAAGRGRSSAVAELIHRLNRWRCDGSSSRRCHADSVEFEAFVFVQGSGLAGAPAGDRSQALLTAVWMP